jgi:RecA/RadA recombinase
MADNTRRRPAVLLTPDASSAATTLEAAAIEVAASAMEEPMASKPVDTSLMISTGSTLLDLAISGGVVRGGGIPGGILMEMYGPSGTGKSALMCEILGNVQRKGGAMAVKDPEGRINEEYAKVYGADIDPRYYDRPDTIVQTFTGIREFVTQHHRHKLTDPINAVGTDSLAALSTELEMGPKGDKIGMKRAKDFSQEMRLTARDIANSGNLVVCTNQIRQGEYGATTPGGVSVEFYASLRLKLLPDLQKGVEVKVDTKKLLGLDTTADTKDQRPPRTKKEDKEDVGKLRKILGIRTNVLIAKSSIDDPYRQAYIYIMFGYGIDDVRANLQWLKDMRQDSMFETPSGKRFVSVGQAITSVEANQEESALREIVIDTWEQIEAAVKQNRARKRRF